MENTNSLLSLSGKLLINVKLNENTIIEEEHLKTSTIFQLQKELNTDDAKKTFWINIYNAYFQILSYREKLLRKSIFTSKVIIIAQKRFSLDDIEHGILRKHLWKWSFGYLSNPLTSALIKALALEKRDYRIHFALNCGAKSCPPIAFYQLESIDSQLTNAMYSFIESETTVNNDNKTITTSKLLQWYSGDFGGSLGIKKIIQEVLGLQLHGYSICFNKYNWENYLENFNN